MNKMTIWQRLNIALILLILLLLGAVGLALWVEESRSAAMHRSDQLTGFRDRVHLEMALLSDSLRGALLSPANELERTRRRDAESNLKKHLDAIRPDFDKYPDFGRALTNLQAFVEGPLAEYHEKVMERMRANPSDAVTYYHSSSPELNTRRDQVLRELGKAIDDIKAAEAMRAKTVSIIGLSCLAVILLASLQVGRLQSAAVTEPLKQLVGALDRMRQGDFTRRLQWDRNDEFGVLSQGLNRLADDLSELVGQVQRSGMQVNTTASQIAVQAREQQSTAREIAVTTAEIGASSRQISATSNDLVRTMNEVSQVAEQTARLAGNTQAAMASMEATMRQIQESSGAITAKLAVLSEKTTNINSVVTTITKVADQTNLLSLNAAIEAEKAGEYGLGFAVVAMEIRRLADQTAVATYDIERMVKEMQSAVAAGVMGMDKFSEEAERGAREVREVSGQVAQIINQVQMLSPRFQAVNEGMNAQARGALQISETLNQLGEAARQTAESLRQSNLAIEQLNDAARSLQASVARFRLPG